MSYDIYRSVLHLLMNHCSFMGNIIVNNNFYIKGLDMNIYQYNNYPFLSNNTFNNILNVSDYINETHGNIYNTDYKKILTKAKKGDFVFLDPPYVEEHNYQFNYNKNEKLDLKFIEDLSVELKKLDKKCVKWMMTQADTKDMRNRFKNYVIKKFSVYRRLKKTYVNELLIMNYY
jgi:site-specific DNA-adenine methylase